LCNSSDKEHYFPELNYVRNPPMENLTRQDVDNVRAIIIIMQNESCFKEHCIKNDKNNSKFTPLISEVKLHLIKQYL